MAWERGSTRGTVCKYFAQGNCARRTACQNRHDLIDMKPIENLFPSVWGKERYPFTTSLSIVYEITASKGGVWKMWYLRSDTRTGTTRFEATDLPSAIPTLLEHLKIRQVSSTFSPFTIEKLILTPGLLR